MSNRKTTLVKKNQSRACVFIDSSDPSLPNQVINDARPFIKLPFPPTIDPRDLITILPDGRVPTRAPNAFIIYRRAFIEAARAEGYNLPMTVISSMTSQSWEQEPNFVKAEYRRLGKEAYNRRNEMCPDSNQRRKREKWNMVSFGNKKNSRKIKKSMRKSKKQPSSLSYCGQNNKIQQEKKFQQSPPSPVPSFSSDLSESDSVVDYKELYSNSERDSNDYYPTPKDTTTFTDTTSNSPDMNKSDYRCEFPFVAPENFSEEFLPSPIQSPIIGIYENLYATTGGFSDSDELSNYSPELSPVIFADNSGTTIFQDLSGNYYYY
ncbi:5681_t:CDS:2 [Diversispora eburnea]|uniref:5681_t:CDS:1 n=1 Tax=Diversispora eburnea TaxID=1213867 RepID=A0A9N8V272_9GLOM|nr:5681_t:CDS:2 [Diversispora eburnea]